MIKKLLVLVLMGMSLLAPAQEAMVTNEPQMADAFRADGKIYVVITVIALIFLALVCFLVYIERKLRRVEEDFRSKR